MTGTQATTVEAMQADQNKAVKKISAKPKAAPKKNWPTRPVAVEDMKIGMTISEHGRVLSAEPFTGRALYGKKLKTKTRYAHVDPWGAVPKGYTLISDHRKGFVFKTTDHADGIFYAGGSTVLDSQVNFRSTERRSTEPSLETGVALSF